ncbi:MAG: secretion protein [Rhodobacteraceae bacterium]|nr:secretion protein [Paracoccaceae bacterium]
MKHRGIGFAVAGLLLAGCAAIENAGQRQDTLAAEVARHRGVLDAQQRGGVVEVDEPFYGSRETGQDQSAAVDDLTNGEPLPEDLEESLGVEIQASAADIAAIQEIVAAASGLDIVVRTTYPTARGIIDVPVAGTMNFQHRGPLSGLLDRIGARFDLAWHFDGTVIRFDRMVNVVHDVPLPSTSGKIQTSVTGVRTDTSSVTASKAVDVDPWEEIRIALEQVAPPPAAITIARNTGRITVFGPPSVQRSAAVVINDFASLYAQRIGLEIATYFIDASSGNNIAVGTFLKAVTGDGVLTLGSGRSTGTTSGSIAIVGGKFGGSSIDFKALATEKDVVDYRQTNTVGQNGVVAPVSLLSTQNYVREVSTRTTDAGDIEQTVKVDSIDTGLSIFALPRLIDNNRLQLNLWLVEASLNSLDTFGSIQLPKTDHRAVEYTVVLAPGETLVVGGYEQETVRKEQSGTGWANFLGLGGSAKASRARTSMVVLIRPTVIAG